VQDYEYSACKYFADLYLVYIINERLWIQCFR